MFGAGLIAQDQALNRINPMLLEQLLVPATRPDARGAVAGAGACRHRRAPRRASIVFDADTAEERGKRGDKSCSCARRPSPRTSTASSRRRAILTSRGGKTSHAAVVARGMGKPCVSGCEAIVIDARERRATVGDIDPARGRRHHHRRHDRQRLSGRGFPTVEAEFFAELATLLSWADEVARLQVMANADTPRDAERAPATTAPMGIGLCRTERMFNDPHRLPIVQAMILADDRAPSGRPRSTGCCRSSARTSKASSSPWPGCR